MDQSQEHPQPVNWRDGLDPRMRKHVAFCQDYAANHNHGAPGHLDYLTIATLAEMIELTDGRITDLEKQITALIRKHKGGA